MMDLDRLRPPSDVEAEASYLAAAIVEGSVLERVPLNAEDFHNTSHAKLLSHLQAYPGPWPIDAQSLKSWLKQADYEPIGPALAEIFEHVGHAAHAGYYADRIRKTAQKRRIILKLNSGLRHCYNGDDDVGSVVGELVESLESIGDGGTDDPFPLVDCTLLATSEYQTRFLVDRLLVAGAPTILAGAQKTLKSLLATDIAVSIATGQDCLGLFHVPEIGSVIYMTGEGGLGLAQDYASRVAQAKGFNLSDVQNLQFCDRLPQLVSATQLGQLRRKLRLHRPALLILDCAYLCMPGGDAGNVMKQGELLARLNRTCLDSAVTLLLLHHTKRNLVNPYAPAELGDIGWAGFSEFASGWLLLSRRERYDPDGRGEHRLWLTVGARIGLSSLWALDVAEGFRTDPGGRKWEVTIGRAADARAEADSRREAERETQRARSLERHRDRLLRAMAKRPEGETASVLRDLAGLKTGEFRTTLASLLEDGAVVSCELKKANRKTPYEGYRIAE